jgi:hypothetical protein
MAQETKEIPFKQYQELMSEICEKAGETFSAAIERAGGIEKIERRKVVSLAYGCIQEFGEQCGSLSCMMYENTAVAQGKKVRTAEMADLPDYKTVAKKINGALKTSVKEATKVVKSSVKEIGADTTLKNAARDNAEFAWVPSGTETCGPCISIASRGWQRMSANALKNGHAEHIHAGCDCQYAVRFDGTSNVEGYDPNEYLQMYEAAEGDTPEEKIKSLRRLAYNSRKKENQRIENFKPLSSSRVVDVLRKASREWIENLTEAEIKAIKRYTYNSGDKKPDRFFERLNSMLRGDTQEDSKLRQYAETISGAIKRNRLEDDVICYRGTNVNPAEGMNIGDVIKIGQFYSTSVVKSKSFTSDYMVKIYVRKGSSAAYIEELSVFKGQREMLLDKDCFYKVISNKENMVELEMI